LDRREFYLDLVHITKTLCPLKSTVNHIFVHSGNLCTFVRITLGLLSLSPWQVYRLENKSCILGHAHLFNSDKTIMAILGKSVKAFCKSNTIEISERYSLTFPPFCYLFLQRLSLRLGTVSGGRNKHTVIIMQLF